MVKVSGAVGDCGPAMPWAWIRPFLFFLLCAGSAHAGQLVCDIIGTQDAEWRGSEYRMSQSKKYREFNPLWLVTGDAPRVAHPDPETDAWVWDELRKLPSVEGHLFTGNLSRGGVLTAALNESETLILLNYLGISSRDGVNVMRANTVVAECAAFVPPPGR